MTVDADVVVVGAGVVGLAIAREFARAGRDVVIVDKNGAIGQETSSRNSEVIHAGIYYPQGSHKARLCLEGKKQLYEFCGKYNVPHSRLGKLTVAADAIERPILDQLLAKAESNGLFDLQKLDKHAVLDLEPALEVDCGLLSPSTGIVDAHALMLAILGDAQAHGASLALNTRLREGRRDGRSGFVLSFADPTEFELTCQQVVLASGLWSNALALDLGVPVDTVPRLHLAKGNYFSLNQRTNFRHLVYPVPSVGGLGVHLTLDMSGQVRFGPDVEWLEDQNPRNIDYQVDPKRADKFYEAIRTYWPGLSDGALQPDYSGVRPKLSGPDGRVVDFKIDGPDAHGIPGLMCLYGMESPALTASLAIAKEVARQLSDDLSA
ncbi:MAG: NAD(P)/FAD-dependent oxidoreductase [Stappiaceae bacterium]